MATDTNGFATLVANSLQRVMLSIVFQQRWGRLGYSMSDSKAQRS